MVACCYVASFVAATSGFAADFLAGAFLAGAFLAGAFLAAGFLAGVAVVSVSPAFLVGMVCSPITDEANGQYRRGHYEAASPPNLRPATYQIKHGRASENSPYLVGTQHGI